MIQQTQVYRDLLRLTTISLFNSPICQKEYHQLLFKWFLHRINNMILVFQSRPGQWEPGTELFNVTDVLQDSFSEMKFSYFFHWLDLVWHVQLCDLWSYLNHFYFFNFNRMCVYYIWKASIEHRFNLVTKTLVEKIILGIKV